MADITYEQLFDVLRREKSRDELQQLEEDFYKKIRGFLKEKKDAFTAKSMEGLTSLKAQRAQIEYQNVKKIVRELYERRERKILTLAVHRTRTDAAVIDTEPLLPEEKNLFENLVKLLTTMRHDSLSFLEDGGVMPEPMAVLKPPKEEPAADGDTVIQEAEEGLLQVKFLAVVPKFVGKNLEVFGPFQEGEQASLPDDVAQVLIKKGRASTS